MQNNLRHRGPDTRQIWQDESVALGHLMLHTTPESLFDKQPLEYKHWVVTADVRLDNRKELFSLLSLAPSSRPNTTDSLLIVMAFEKWGKRCSEYLVGDFAFAIWDREQRSLYCARDPTGVRQLFYFDSPDFLVFASEIPAIADLAMVSCALDVDHFTNYLILLETTEEAAADTFIRGIKRVMPANWLSWESQKLITQLYWRRNPDTRIKFKDERDYGLALRELMEQAVHDRLRTNFPVGVTLSGGLDSSSVACMAARKLAKEGKSLYSASSVLPPNYQGYTYEQDERSYIASVLAQEKNIIPTFVTAQGIGAFDGLAAIFDKTYELVNHFYYMDEALSQSLAPHARVVLTGYLGDATTSNPGHYVLSTLVKQLRFRAAFDVLHSRKKFAASQSYRNQLKKDLLMPLIPHDLLISIRKIRGTYAKHSFSLLDSAASQSFISEERARRLHEQEARIFAHTHDHYQDIWNDTYQFSGGDSCLSSYQGQEDAHPLIDKRIIEFLWACPPECFIYQGWPRGFVRRAMEGVLPKQVLWRKDKNHYSPDFQRRMIDQIPELKKSLEASIMGKPHPYLNVEHILDQLLALQGKEKFDLKSLSVVHRGILSLKYLQWLENI